MNDLSYIDWSASSDRAIIVMLGSFIRRSRLRQKKTQAELSSEAGIARSTLSLFEKGENTSLLVFIQLLRALGMLGLLGEFREREKLSPLQLAKIQHRMPQRIKHTSKKSSGEK